MEVQLDGEGKRSRRSCVLRPASLGCPSGWVVGKWRTDGVSPAGSSWREKWRTVSLHFAVPPIQCQSLLQALPKPVVPRIRDFQLDGTFSTDVRVFVDFAKLLKLPPPKRSRFAG